MQIHRILGDDLTEALRRARATHGEDAIVLGHEVLEGGGVAVSVTRERAIVAAAPASARSRAAALVKPRGARSTSSAGSGASSDSGLCDLERRLVLHGASARWASEVARAVGRGGARGTMAIDAAAEVIGKRVKIAPSPKIGKEPLVLAFVGTSGAGKTTSLAKLAVRLTQSRRRVALVTLDRERVGAAAQLQAYGELLGASVDVVASAAELSAAIARRHRAHAVLVDTSAVNSREPERVRDLGLLLDAVRRDAPLETYAVLSATTQRNDLRESLTTLRQLRPSAAIVTKLDETRRAGGAVECAARAGLPLVFFASGREASQGLTRPTSDQCADILLRGRIA